MIGILSRPEVRLILVVAAVLGIGLIAGVLSDQYGPIDPTDPGWKARVTNDTSQAVSVQSPRGTLLIPAGKQDIAVSPGPGQLHAVYEIFDEGGNLLGCLTIDLNKSRTVSAKVSDMKPCAQ